MLETIFSRFQPKSPTTNRKTHRRRFGVIPSEPCRASSMQALWETPCGEKAPSESIEQTLY